MTEAVAKKNKPARNLSTVPSEPKAKRERKSTPTTFAGQLRELANKHRGKISKLTGAEQKLERKLSIVRAQRQAAEGPLRDVEEMLNRRPELPNLEPTNIGGEVVDTDLLGADAEPVNQ